MPIGPRVTRARQLGLCIECTHKPVEEGFTKCPQCRHMERRSWQRRRDRVNLAARLRKQNAKQLITWLRACLAAELAGQALPARPEPLTWVDPRWCVWDRLRPKPRRRRGRPSKYYKYTPRALPKPPVSVIDSISLSEQGTGDAPCVAPHQNEPPRALASEPPDPHTQVQD